LTFFVHSFWWMVVSFGQLVFQRLIYQRFYSNKPQEFVDFLSYCNISCFIFDHRYHAYYLHGKSVHSHADIPLEEMNEQISSEMKGHTRPRVLAANPSGGEAEVDSWEMYLTPSLRSQYDVEYAGLLDIAISASARNERQLEVVEAKRATRATASTMSNKLIEAHYNLDHFLKDFIDKIDNKYTWDTGVLTYFQRRFQVRSRKYSLAPHFCALLPLLPLLHHSMASLAPCPLAPAGAAPGLHHAQEHHAVRRHRV
jgi:meckelin